MNLRSSACPFILQKPLCQAAVISAASQAFKHFPLMRCFYFCSQWHSQSALAVQREGSRGAAWADPIMDETGSLKTLFMLPGELFKRKKLLGLHWGHEKGCCLYIDQGEMSNTRVTVSIFFVLSLSFILLFIFLVGFGSPATNFVLHVFLSSYLSFWLSFLAWDTSWTLPSSVCPSRTFFLLCVGWDLIFSMPPDAQIEVPVSCRIHTQVRPKLCAFRLFCFSIINEESWSQQAHMIMEVVLLDQ